MSTNFHALPTYHRIFLGLTHANATTERNIGRCWHNGYGGGNSLYEIQQTLFNYTQYIKGYSTLISPFIAFKFALTIFSTVVG